MLGVLLESKAGKQRRTAGATFSIVVHVAIIAAVAVGTVQGKTTPPEKPHAVFIQIAPAKPPVVREQTRSTPVTSSPTLPANMVIRHIDPPTITPSTLPPIDMTAGLAADSIVIGGGHGTSVGSSLGALVGDDQPGDDRDWDVHELLMHVITPARPRYPESLRSAGVDGRVLVQFTVDTTGRVDLPSVKIIESTHDLFTRAVREALSHFRFRPAEAGGRRVAALAQMPFEFHITR
jgi:protein TonB